MCCKGAEVQVPAQMPQHLPRPLDRASGAQCHPGCSHRRREGCDALAQVAGLKCSLQRGSRCATTNLVPCETWFDAPASAAAPAGGGSPGGGRGGGGARACDAEVVCADCWMHLKKVCPHDPVCRACFLVAQIGERGLMRAVLHLPDPAASAPEQLLITVRTTLPPSPPPPPLPLSFPQCRLRVFPTPA